MSLPFLCVCHYIRKEGVQNFRRIGHGLDPPAGPFLRGLTTIFWHFCHFRAPCTRHKQMVDFKRWSFSFLMQWKNNLCKSANGVVKNKQKKPQFCSILPLAEITNILVSPEILIQMRRNWCLLPHFHTWRFHFWCPFYAIRSLDGAKLRFSSWITFL